MTWLIWCPECEYNTEVPEMCQWAQAVSRGDYPHRRPDGGDCYNKMKVINMNPKGANTEERDLSKRLEKKRGRP